MVDFSRVQKELHECKMNMDVSGINVNPKGDSLTHLIGTIPGPMGTPYEGGIFKIDIVLPGTPWLWLGFHVFIQILGSGRGF